MGAATADLTRPYVSHRCKNPSRIWSDTADVANPRYFLVQALTAVLDAFNGEFWLCRNRNWIAGFFRDPPRRERFDERHQVGAVLIRKRRPARHIGEIETAPERIGQV